MKFKYCNSLVEAKKYACTLLYAMYSSTIVKFSQKYLGSYIILVDLIVRFTVLRYVHRIGFLSTVIDQSDFTERLRDR